MGRATHRLHGFTLIEISIVLVIIGLLVGAVVLGREMIRAAETRKVISKLREFQTAFTTFKMKYDCLPGDCRYATSLFPAAPSCPAGSAAGTCNGNGNLQIAQGAYTGSERTYFWQHLGCAALIGGQYASDWPTGEVSSDYVPYVVGKVGINPNYSNPYTVFWYQTYGYQNYLHLGRVDTVAYSSDYVSRTGAMDCARLKDIDDKIDNGRPGTGKVMVCLTQCTDDAAPTASETANYRTSSTLTGIMAVVLQ